MSIFSNPHLAQLYVASKMNDFPHVAVEVPVPTKTHKYKRFAHEKRAKREPGVKRVQTPYVMVTKWDVEIANKKHKKVGRERDRANKYGNWSDNRTDSYYEDLVNGNEQDQLEQRIKTKASLNEYKPVFNLANQDGWPSWESYNVKQETDAIWEDIDNVKELSREEYYQAWRKILNSPEQLAVNAANDAHNAQQAALYGDVLYTIELGGETDEEAEWDGELAEIETDDE